MNGCVAHRACLVLRGLIVGGTRWALHRECVALKAQKIDLAHAQETRVCRPMWRVATIAAFRFDGHVLVNKRTEFVGMTLGANLVATRQCPYLTDGGGAMGVVTIAALDQAFIDAVVIGLGKIRLGGRMASVAEIGLRSHQQELAFGRVMWRVTVETSDVIVGMR